MHVETDIQIGIVGKCSKLEKIVGGRTDEQKPRYRMKTPSCRLGNFFSEEEFRHGV